MQSVTKSVTSTLVGIALGQDKISGVSVKVMDFFNENEIGNVDDWKRDLSLEDILTMRSGIDWNESISYTNPENSTIQLEASENWVDFVINRKMDAEPGTVFEYNSGASVLLSYIIKESTGMYVDEYAEKYLFGPLGIENYYWKKTPTGLPDTEGGLYLEIHDLAKLGYLYLHDGIWEEDRILPQGWVESVVTPHVEDTTPGNDRNNLGYGYQWWLIPYKDDPVSYIYTCLGYGGQYLFVVPEYDLVAVFTAWNIYNSSRLPRDVIFDYVLKSIK